MTLCIATMGTLPLTTEKQAQWSQYSTQIQCNDCERHRSQEISTHNLNHGLYW